VKSNVAHIRQMVIDAGRCVLRIPAEDFASIPQALHGILLNDAILLVRS